MFFLVPLLIYEYLSYWIFLMCSLLIGRFMVILFYGHECWRLRFYQTCENGVNDAETFICSAFVESYKCGFLRCTKRANVSLFKRDTCPFFCCFWHPSDSSTRFQRWRTYSEMTTTTCSAPRVTGDNPNFRRQHLELLFEMYNVKNTFLKGQPWRWCGAGPQSTSSLVSSGAPLRITLHVRNSSVIHALHGLKSTICKWTKIFCLIF